MIPLPYPIFSHHPIDWNDPKHPLACKEPRRGRRAVLRVVVAAPGGPLVVYCAHLEVFCGMLDRISQLADIFQDSKDTIRDSKDSCHQVILGDLNTMAHGIARLSQHYCTDRMRWLSIGKDEATVLERTVLSIEDAQYNPRNDDAPKGPSAAISTINRQLLKWGLEESIAQKATNPGFYCPFPANSTVTLNNPKYHWLKLHLMKGKLDWMLLRRLKCIEKRMGNEDYTLSDHKWLMCDVVWD